MWTVIWSDKSVRQLRNIDKINKQRIYGVVTEISIDPYRAVERLVNSTFYRLNVGKYRIILNLQQRVMTIFVVEIDHRRRIYK